MKFRRGISVLFILVLALTIVGSADAKQVGMRIDEPMPVHGHGGETDGGRIHLPGFFASSLSAVPLTTGNLTAMTFGNVTKNDNSWYNPSNGIFQPTVAGTYLVMANATMICTTTITRIAISVFNGGFGVTPIDNRLAASFTGNQYQSISSSQLVYLNGTTDWISMSVQINGTGTCSLLTSPVSNFQAMLISY